MLDFSLYINVLFFGLLGIGMFFGFLRGLKKTIYKLIVMIIFYTVFFLTIDWVVSAIWNMPIPGLGNIMGQYIPELSNAASLKQAMPVMLENSLGDMFDTSLSNPEFLAFVTGFSLFSIKLVYAVLCFTLFKWIYKLIFLIIRMIFFKTKDKKKSKNRGMGALVGILNGALTCYLIVVIFGGMVNMVQNSLKIIPEEVKTEQDEFVEILDYTEDFIDAYNNSIVVRTSNLISVKTDNEYTVLSHHLFDRIFSFKYKDDYREERISFRKELAIAVDINDIYVESDFKTTDDLSDITGAEVRDAFTILSKSDLFNVVTPIGVEMASDYLDIDIALSKDKLYTINWKNEFMRLGEVAAVSFDLINTAGLMDDNANLETVTIDGTQVRSLFNSLSESKLVTLTAYEAINPLLTEAGADVEAIITVPEGIVWEEEIKAIGEVAGSIVDTQITIGDVESGDPNVILTSLSTLDFTVILNSKIMSNALINILTDNSNFEGFDVFEIPETVEWYDTVDDDGTITKNGELRNILIAVNKITDDASNIDFTNIDMNVISKISNESIDAICESEVLVATVSSAIADMDLGETPLLIADSVYDENHYIKNTELKALAKSAKIVVNTLACDEGDQTCNSGFDVTKAFDLSDDDINELLTSQIISYTIGNLIIEQGGEVLTIPSQSLDDQVFVDNVAQDVVASDEIKLMFKAVSALGITDLENMTFDASILNNLAIETDPKVLDQTKANKLFASNIIHATLSTMLLDLTTGESQVLVVPHQNALGEDIITTNEIDYVTTDELTAVLEAVLVLNITDFANVETLELQLIIDEIDTLLNSAILHATISDQLFDLATDKVTIPYVDENNLSIRVTVGDTPETEVIYIKKTELTSLLDGLKILGMTDINNFTGTVNLSNIYETSQQTALLESAILHATVSKQLLDLDPTILEVPYIDSTDGAVRKTVGIVGEETEYVTKTEIKAIIEALEVLSIDDVNNYSGTIDLDLFNDRTNREILLNSASLHAKSSKQIIDLTTTNNTIVVPTQDVDGNVVRFVKVAPEMTTEYVDKEEIHRMFEALKLLNINSIDGFTGTVALNNFYGENKVNQTTLLASASMHATVSKQLLDLDPTTLTVPYIDSDDGEVRKTVLETEFVVKGEVEAIIDALGVLGIDDVNNYTGTIDLNTFNDRTNREILLSSASLHAKASDQILDLNTSGTLVVPMEDIDQNTIRMTKGAPLLTTEYVDKEEIHNLFEVLKLLNINSVDGFTGTVTLDNFTGVNKGNQTILLASASMHATVSDQILGLDASVLTVPYVNANDIEIRKTIQQTEFVDKEEIKAIIDAFDVLNINDVNNYTGTIDLNSFNDYNTREILLASASLHAKASKQILDLDATNTLVVPIEDSAQVTIRFTRFHTLQNTEYVNKSEIHHLFDALTILNIFEVTGFAGNIDLGILNNDIDKQNTLLSSASMHATISKQMIDLGPNVLLIPDHDIDNLYNIHSQVLGTNYIHKQEIKNVINALNVLGVSDVTQFNGSFTLSYVSTDANQTILLQSASIHATISDKLLGLGDSVLIVPMVAQDGITPIQSGMTSSFTNLTVPNYVVKDEIKSIINAFITMGYADLDNFGTSIDTTRFFNDIPLLLNSVSIHATVSKNILDNALADNNNYGSLTLIVPPTYRENVVGIPETYINKTELEHLLTSLDLLGITDFSQGMSATTITSKTDIELFDILASGSIHATFDNMLKGNDNIIIPDEAKVAKFSMSDPLITTEAEIVYFIKAVQAFEISDFTQASFIIEDIETLSPENQTTVLNSMIVLNTLTEQLRISYPVLMSTVPQQYYYNGDTSSFLTSDGILYVLTLI